MAIQLMVIQHEGVFETLLDLMVVLLDEVTMLRMWST